MTEIMRSMGDITIAPRLSEIINKATMLGLSQRFQADAKKRRPCNRREIRFDAG